MSPWVAIVKRAIHRSIPRPSRWKRPKTMMSNTRPPAELQTHAFTHPIRGAVPFSGRRTGGVASLNLRLISATPIGVDGR